MGIKGRGQEEKVQGESGTRDGSARQQYKQWQGGWQQDIQVQDGGGNFIERDNNGRDFCWGYIIAGGRCCSLRDYVSWGDRKGRVSCAIRLQFCGGDDAPWVIVPHQGGNHGERLRVVLWNGKVVEIDITSCYEMSCHSGGGHWGEMPCTMRHHASWGGLAVVVNCCKWRFWLQRGILYCKMATLQEEMLRHKMAKSSGHVAWRHCKGTHRVIKLQWCWGIRPWQMSQGEMLHHEMGNRAGGDIAGRQCRERCCTMRLWYVLGR